MLKLASISRKPLSVVVLACALGACSGADSGVELNGKLFDVVGLSGVGGKRSGEPRLAERAPLVPPPRTDALPAPGGVSPQPSHMAWPDDPDRKRQAQAAAQEKDWKKYCSDPLIGGTDHERATREAECTQKQGGGVLGFATSWFNTKKEGASPVATDEGDPIVTGSTKPAAAKTR